MVTIIAAVSSNGVIGESNRLITKNPEDMKHFKDTTTDHVVIMGRKTCESIPGNYLEDRVNIVISSDVDNVPDNPELYPVNSLEEALFYGRKLCDSGVVDSDEIFIIGGGQVYKEALEKNLVDRMILTHFNQIVDGDIYFPDWNPVEWGIVNVRKSECVGSFTIVDYDKKRTVR